MHTDLHNDFQKQPFSPRILDFLRVLVGAFGCFAADCTQQHPAAKHSFYSLSPVLDSPLRRACVPLLPGAAHDSAQFLRRDLWPRRARKRGASPHCYYRFLIERILIGDSCIPVRRFPNATCIAWSAVALNSTMVSLLGFIVISISFGY